MNSVEENLLRALLDLEQAAKMRAAANPKTNIGDLLRRLDEMANELPAGTDPQLLHFLRRKSYDKARRWLQGEREFE